MTVAGFHATPSPRPQRTYWLLEPLPAVRASGLRKAEVPLLFETSDGDITVAIDSTEPLAARLLREADEHALEGSTLQRIQDDLDAWSEARRDGWVLRVAAGPPPENVVVRLVNRQGEGLSLRVIEGVEVLREMRIRARTGGRSLYWRAVSRLPILD